ncbi:MAG: ATP-binding region ATPase protein [Actinomycetia bacterium]|nr:ATP-binding region ATPase protein [Actinomycetes bacterium]
MPGDGSIQGQLTRTVAAGAVAPLAVAVVAVAVLAGNGGSALAIAAVIVISVACSVLVWTRGMKRVHALRRRFERATRLANEVATVRLPEALDAARDGRRVTAEQTPLLPDERDELGALISALDRTQRTAITVASEQARVRRQASDMFVDLGRRHQSLIERTLELVADLEAREREPGTIADLLRLDHLVTRMRRNAESLLVLAGTEPGRVGRGSGDVTALVRGAFGEIEAYSRVDLDEIEPERVVGRASGAVAHILAELLENATAFSAPETRVRVTGAHRADGYMLSVIDHGIGLPADDLAEANQRLTQFRTVEFAPPRRLGLAVVAELARRHGIVVQLRDTPGGGTTAGMLLPAVLLASTGTGAPSPRPAAEPEPTPAATPATPAATPAAASVEPAPDPVATSAEPEPEPIDLTVSEAMDAHPADADAASLLPRRVRGARLPDLGPARDDTNETPVREPQDVREQLTGLQAGMQRARTDVSANLTAPAPTPPQPPLSVVPAETGAEAGAEADVYEAPDLTASGLARRVAGAQLPDTGPPRDSSAPQHSRSADDVRQALTSFQHGIARGTLEREHDGDDDDHDGEATS